jgi:glutaredoxin
MKIEVFSAGCPLCLRVIEQVERAAHDGDEVVIHNMFEEESEFLADLYGVRQLPAVFVERRQIPVIDD